MNISINPFRHTRIAKAGIGLNHKADISVIKNNKKLYGKLIPMQNSLDYMAEHYKIDFNLYELPISHKCFITCQNGKKISFSDDIGIEDENSNIARKIYEAASKVL